MPRSYWVPVIAAVGFIILSDLSVAQTNQANDPNNATQTIQKAANPRPLQTPAKTEIAEDKPKTDKQQTDIEVIQEKGERWLWRLMRDPIAVITLLLFIIGGIQIEISRRTSKRQLRAYITITVDHEGRWGAGDTPEVKFLIANTGQTPARNVRFAGRAEISDSNDIDMPTLTDDAARMVIGAGQEDEKIIEANRDFFSDDIDEMFASRRCVVCSGMVTYSDVFGDEWKTSVAVFFTGPDFGIRYCRDGNDAT